MPEAEAFDALTAEFYEAWLHYHPERALEVGLAVRGRVLPARGDDDRAALRAWLEELLLALDELDFSALDADRQLDWELLAGAARVEHRELAPGGWDRPDDPGQPGQPGGWLDSGLRDGPFDALPVLLRCLNAALAGTDPSLLDRLLEELPEYLRGSQAGLRAASTGLCGPLVRAAAQEAREGAGRLRALARGAWLKDQARPQSALAAGLESAALMLAAHAEVLSDELAPRGRATPGCGAAHLGLRLRALHFLDADPEDGHPELVRVLELAERCDAAPPVAPDWAPRPPPWAGQGPAPGGTRHLPRLLANGATLGIGWTSDPADLRGMAATDGPGADRRRLGLLLARLDLDLHRGRCAAEEGVARLRAAGCGAAAADRLLARLARHPGDALAAVLGWPLLASGLAETAGAAGLGAAWRARLGALGPIPLSLALRYAGRCAAEPIR